VGPVWQLAPLATSRPAADSQGGAAAIARLTADAATWVMGARSAPELTAGPSFVILRRQASQGLGRDRGHINGVPPAAGCLDLSPPALSSSRDGD